MPDPQNEKKINKMICKKMKLNKLDYKHNVECKFKSKNPKKRTMG